MVTYDSAASYVGEATDIQAKITRIDAIIIALETTALVAAGTGNISEYQLDDGQTKIKTVYRNANDVANAITAFERIKQRYINQLTGRVIRLVDGKNFTGCN